MRTPSPGEIPGAILGMLAALVPLAAVIEEPVDLFVLEIQGMV